MLDRFELCLTQLLLDPAILSPFFRHFRLLDIFGQFQLTRYLECILPQRFQVFQLLSCLFHFQIKVRFNCDWWICVRKAKLNTKLFVSRSFQLL
jgi:hypothetical protein